MTWSIKLHKKKKEAIIVLFSFYRVQFSFHKRTFLLGLGVGLSIESTLSFGKTSLFHCFAWKWFGRLGLGVGLLIDTKTREEKEEKKMRIEKIMG